MALRILSRNLATSARRPALDLNAAPSFMLGKAKDGAAAAQASITFTQIETGVAPPLAPVQVAGRPHLPACNGKGLPAFLSNPTPTFPLALQASGDVTDLKRSARSLKAMLDDKLTTHPAIVVHGLGLDDPEQFSSFMQTVKAEYDCSKFMGGRSMTSTNVAQQVRTGSDDDPRYTIEPHNEYNVASLHRPRKLFLVVGEEPTHGGEWPITDGRKVFAQLDQAVIDKFEEHGVRYEIWYPKTGGYNNWTENIACNKEEAEIYLAGAGCQWDWQEDDSLLIHRVLPAVVDHPHTGERVWFNQIQAHHNTFYKDCHPHFSDEDDASVGHWPVHTKYGDGTEIETETLEHIRDVTWNNTVAVHCKKGCLLVLDNYLTMHGRMGYTPDTPRKTFVSITYE